MKKTLLGLVMSTLFVAGTACAGSISDVPATLAVSGTVTAQADNCTLQLGKTVVSMSDDVANLPAQGSAATSGSALNMLIAGGSACQSAVDEGTFAYRFLGTADDADGTTLANSDTSEGAAKGVGVGIFTLGRQPLVVNSDTLTVESRGNRIIFQMVKLTGQQPVAGSLKSTVTIQVERL